MGANNEEVSPQAPLSISNSDVSVTQKHVKLHTQQDKLHNVIIPFAKAHDDAQPPHHATPYAAGGDLHSIESIKILAGSQALVATGLKIALPSGTYGRIAPRSGLAVKHQISVGAGVIDEDYRGEIKVLLMNHGKEEFVIQKGERIAQLIIQEIATTGMPVPAVTETVQIYRMREDVKKPIVEHSAVKVYSDENGVVPANNMRIFKTGIRIAVPTGYYAHASPLTNLAIAHGIELFAGVIDSDYRGELKVLLFNHSEKDFIVNAGDAVMQILVEKIATPTYEKVTKLPETVRGAGGFGSTGFSNSNAILTTDDNTVTKENVVTVPRSVSMKRAVNFLPLVDAGIIPTYESDGAAAADVYSSQPQTVPPHGRCLVNTGLVAVVAPGYYARMAPRSGLAVKHRIHIGAGVQWTSKESAQIQVLLYNFGSKPFGIKHGDRIAQVIFEQIAIPELNFVEELSETERGENGFGSTGVNRIAG